jgi:hypothetical protein
MRVAFLTEMGFEGKIPSNHPNMRTEFAWMFALGADHYNIHHIDGVKDYDHVFIIFPKGRVFLSAEGNKMIDGINPATNLLQSNFIQRLKEVNKKIYYVQEGPHWWFNEYELADQIQFYNMLTSCDAILAHNESDISYYKGLVPTASVYVLPSLMIEETVEDIKSEPENKVIIGGNFARWYGGFESFIVAQEFELPIWAQTSHVTRQGEDQLINQLPRMYWTDWIRQLSTFKYAVHLMPTVAAGTFSLNCAYLGIPCIGNEKVDTQRICHPDLAVDVDNVEEARKLARQLKDPEYWKYCSTVAKEKYKLYNLDNWLTKLNEILK